MNLSAVILTKNEELNIADCLRHLDWAGQIVVLDAGSVDQTKQLVQSAKAEWHEHPFQDFADQRNYAMTLCRHDWILFIDADERVSSALADEIQTVLDKLPRAYAIPRQNFFFGKRLKYSGSVEDAPVRLFPQGSGSWRQPVHEYFETSLPVSKLNAPLLHHTTRDLDHYLSKVRTYVPLEVRTMQVKGRRAHWWDILIRPPAKFLFLYIIKRGLLDGWAGLQFAVLSMYYDYKKYSTFYKISQNKQNPQ